MAIILDKVIIRDAGNTINTSTNYSELNVKAQGIVDDIVANTEANAAAQEAFINSNVGTMTTQIASLIDPTGTGYTTEYSDATTKTQNEANFTASGHTKLPKAYIETNTPYTMIDPSTDAINVGGRLVEVVGEELVTNGDFSDGTTGWTIDAGVTVNNTECVFDTTSASLGCTQYIGIPVGSTVTVTYTVRNYVSGTHRLRYPFIGTTNTGNGTFTQTSNTVDAGLRVAVLTTSNVVNDYTIDNISVKEIQPIVLPNAPFDTDTSHTTTTYSATQDVGKGDFVVSGQELLTSLGWTAPTGTTVSDGLVNVDISIDSAIYTRAYKEIPTIEGVQYVISLEIANGTGNVQVRDWASPTGNILLASGDGVTTKTFTGDSSGSITLSTYLTVAGTASISNISVTPYNDIVQATRDTVDMYDYEFMPNDSSGHIISDNDVLLISGFDISNGYYRYSGVSGALSSLPSSFDMKTVLNYTYLGTASTMSLANPYFQNVSTDENGSTSQLAVTRDDVWMHLVTKDTYTYSKHSFKGIYQFSENVIADEVMQTYCGSPISPNLYEITVDGTDYYAVFGGMSTRLNAGAFHPSYNIMGCKHYKLTGVADKQWYDTGIDIFSSYGTFTFDNGTYAIQASSGYVSTAKSGRPDSAFYDKAYKNQVTLRTSLAFTPSKSDMLEETATNYANGQIDGVEGLVETVVSSSSSTITYKSGAVIKIDLTFMWLSTEPQTDGKLQLSVNGVTDNRPIDSYYRSISDDNLVIIFNEDAGYIVTDVVEFVAITRKSNIKYSGEIPHTDLIGNPSSYPSMITDTLASGKSVYLNPLLVGQDGTDYTIIDTSHTSRVMSKKALALLSVIGTNDTETGWYKLGVSSDGTPSSAEYEQLNSVANTTITNLSDSKVHPEVTQYLFNYIAKTKSTIKRNDIKIIQVLPKVFASNSHSIYKGGNAVYSAGMGVSTGDAFESKYLENLEVLSNAEYTNAPKNTIASGTVGVTTVMWTDRATADAYTDGNLIVLGRVYVRIDTDFTGAMSVWNPIKWELFDLSPTHNTISLDSSGDKAVKYFLALGKDSDNNAYAMVASKEMVWDDSADNDNIVALDTSITQTVTAGILYECNGGQLNGYIIECLVTSSIGINNYTVTSDGKILNATNGTQTYIVIWDGNGFGDSNEFEQLIDGTDTDDNGNIVKTDISYINLNYKMEN